MSGSIFFLDFKEITIKMTPFLFFLHLVNAIYTVVADQMFLVHFSVQCTVTIPSISIRVCSQ